MPTTRARLVNAAFALFEEQGFHETTVEDITARAGTGRTTFFRHFRGKEDVVFPDHDALLAKVDARLATATPETREVALREAARIVLDHYLEDGDSARARYRLTRSVPALRDRESASVQRYLRLFRRHLSAWLADETDGRLRAELLAAAVITAHNHVLRRWLQGEVTDVAAAFDHAIDRALDPALDRALDPAGGAPRSTPGAVPAATVVVHTTGYDVEQILREVRSALSGDAEAS